MNSDFSPELRRELLDDFYAECDELLTALRTGLAQLDSLGTGGRADANVVEGLFRSTHTLKGISAIADLRPAEQLAHAMEELLRALSKREKQIDDAVVDLLLAGTQGLERIVTAHRLGRELPDSRDLLAQLGQALPPRSPGQAAAPVVAAPEELVRPDPIANARERGLHLQVVTFSPSPALDKRGVNVTSVRKRLGAIGEIVSATPSVKGKGAMVFEFVVGTIKPVSDAPKWEADKIHFAPYKAAPLAPRPDENGPRENITEALSLAPSHLVRVDLARLDDLMRITGEMVMQRSRLEERLQQAQGENAGLKEVNLALGRSLREMREALTRVRMVPMAEIFARIPFVVRDLMRGSDKKVRVALEGNQTEVDKFLVERLKEPLLHLVRNAFVHGIEPAADRTIAGKPAEATITLKARSAGESVIIQIRDDGRGIDAAAVATRAAAMGLQVPSPLDANALLRILCAPGFSTQDQADRAAGRGVGMSVVANVVRELGGILAFETTQGKGTEFTLRIPLTLSIADAIVVTIGGQNCAIPQSAVEEIIQIPSAQARSINQAEVVPYREGLLPFVRLQKMFEAKRADAELLTILVVSTDRGATGLVVDRVCAQREIVIRPLADPLLQVPGISGATELGDGRPLLILDPHAITEGVVRPNNNADNPALALSDASRS